MPRVKFLKFGGVRFKPLVDTKVINSYVNNLPENRRENMYEVAKELVDHNMIKIIPGEMSSTEDDSCL